MGILQNSQIIMDTAGKSQNLTRNQKEAVGLLSMGTFLEYFDLMLYIHMAALLNELFFPAADPHTTQLFLAFTFCSTYLLRPIGALVFGWIGDNMGRKSTVIITTAMMAVSCIIMAILPTYAQIGITATWVVIICRVVQGMSSMGELIGAEIYLTETIAPPKHYSYVTLLSFLAELGGTAALGIASLVTIQGFNWRYAFLIGAAIALVGSIARTALRETPDFADAKRRIKRTFEDTDTKTAELKNNPIWQEKINLKTALALFLIRGPWPVFFFFAYVHCGSVLKESFGYSTEQVIHQNFILSIVQAVGVLPLIYLGGKIYPLLILKFKLVVFTIFILITPYLLNNATSPFDVLLIQSFIMFFVPDLDPAIPIFYKYFPVFKRFTSTAFIYALSRAIMFTVTSFGCVYLIDYCGNYGLFIIIIPLIIGYGFGILHFEKLEKESGNHP